MTTSGVTSWPLTVGDIVTQAAYKLGAYSAGEALSGEDMSDGILTLNGMLNYWAGEGNLFRETTGTLTIPAGVGSVALPSDLRDVNSVRNVLSSGYSRQLQSWNRAQFYALPNRTQASSSGPSCYYLSRGVSGAVLNIWPTPSIDITLEIDYSRMPDTATDPGETVDVPQDWQEALIYGLASRLADIFGSSNTDPGTVARVDQRGQIAYQKLLDRDRPDAYYFYPAED